MNNKIYLNKTGLPKIEGIILSLLRELLLTNAMNLNSCNLLPNTGINLYCILDLSSSISTNAKHSVCFPSNSSNKNQCDKDNPC